MKNYPAITRAATMMARSNGAINRHRSEKIFLEGLCEVLMHAPHELSDIERWLATQSDDDILTIVDGEEGDQRALLAQSPPGTDMLMNDIWERAI